MKIIVRHNSFIVYPSAKNVYIVDEFTKEFNVYSTIKTDNGMKKELSSQFFTGNKFKTEYIFNIEALKYFISKLKSLNFNKDDVTFINDKPTIERNLNVFSKGNLKPRDYQIEYLARVLKEGNPYRLISLGTGKGKALTNDTKVKTINGFNYIGNLKENDIIYSEFNKESKVLKVYPQGLKETYKITFEDGRAIETDGSHLWKVKLLDRNVNKDTLLTTEELLNISEDIYVPNENIDPMLTSNQSILLNSFLTKSPIRGDYEDLIKVMLKLKTLNISARVSKWKDSYRLTKSKIELTSFIKIKSIVNTYILKNMTCIYIDNESHLFLTDNNIYTHNTFIASKALIELNSNVAILILPRYITKWVSDLKNLLNIKETDIKVIQGKSSLVELMSDALNNKFYKFVIFSNKTFLNYTKEYINAIDDSFVDYPILPLDLSKKLNLGTLLIDEIHQEFHSMFIASLYFNVERVIGLSATLISKNKDLTKMYNIMFPRDSWIEIEEDKKYTNVYPTRYTISNPHTLRLQNRGGFGYSQIVFEQSIMKNKRLLRNYLDMIKFFVFVDYYNVKKKNEKLAIYAQSVKMCEYIVRHLKRDKKLRKLSIKRYVANDKYKDAIYSDVRVATLGKAGTALDIPKLITVIQTINVDSPQANIQVMGRLREVLGSVTRFVYLYSSSIGKHRHYHKNRMRTLSYKTKQFIHREYKGDL